MSIMVVFPICFKIMFFKINKCLFCFNTTNLLFQMIPDDNTSNVSRQEFIDLLCRITKSAEEMTTEPDVTIIDETTTTMEEGEIITLGDDDDDDDIEMTNRKEIEDGEITESQGSDV
jgi:hypothetical protein